MEEEKWIKHYSNKHDILLVGEGNFSFAASLATAFGHAHKIVATSLDTQEILETKHPTAASNLVLLRNKGCTIIHGVDAGTMRHHHLLAHRKFDRIVFNFPHAGFPASERQSFQIEIHQGVVRGFLINGYEMVRTGGQLHITHKTAYPFSQWNIEELGRKQGFVLLEETEFDISDYAGYSNKRGSGYNSDECFPVGACSTFRFIKL